MKIIKINGNNVHRKQLDNADPHSVVRSLMTLAGMKYKWGEKHSKPIILIMLLTSKGTADEAEFPYINI